MSSSDRETLLFLFGSNSHGQLGIQGNHSLIKPRLAKEFSDIFIRDVWCGAGETIIVSECGRVWKTKGDLGGFGEIHLKGIHVARALSTSLYTVMFDKLGCLYILNEKNSLQKIELPSPVVQLEAGALFVIILLSDGSVYSMGMNLNYRQLGYETPSSHDSSIDLLKTPQKITSLTHTHVLKVSVGSNHSVCLTSEGNVIGWGSNSFGELGFEDRDAAVFPPKRLDVVSRGQISTLSAGDRVTLLTEGETGHVKVLGRPRQGSGGPPPTESSSQYPGFNSSTSVIQTTATGGGWGNSHTVFTTENKRVYALGSNSVGQLGSTTSGKTQSDTPVEVDLPYSLDIKNIKVSAGWVHSAALLTVSKTTESSELFLRACGSLTPLAIDVLEKIFLYLPRFALNQLSTICQRFNIAYRHDVFWKDNADRMCITPSQDSSLFDQLVEKKRKQYNRGFFDNMTPSALSGLIGGLFKKTESRLLFVGLDASGKTTMLYKMKLGEVIATIPTIGFNVETVETKNMSLTMWDVGGPDKIRPLWRHYMEGTDVLVFVVDSTDAYRLGEAKKELERFADEPQLEDVAFLIYANKQDIPSALSVMEITEKMDLPGILKGKLWYVQPCSGITGDGLFEGMNWVEDVVKRKRQKKKN